MAFSKDGFYYDEQIKTYICQFMAIFTNLEVMTGLTGNREQALISVPVKYGASDRVVASIIGDNTQNKLLRLPAMSAYMRNIRQAPERAVGTGVERRKAFVPLGGLVPDDIQVIHQRKPVPYDLEMELMIYASNTDQHLQILEQILPLFDPTLDIQVSDNLFDWKRLTTVRLVNINSDSNYPIGSERRIVQSTLQFTMPIHLDIPAEIRTNYIKKIFLRVSAIASDITNTFDAISDLDANNVPYQLVQDGSGIQL